MALTPGTRLGPYEIQSALGAGGMGEVYKARDTRLDRTVAVKVLPEHVASDPDLRQRFEREAKALAALSHPHICPVYDVGRQEGIDFLVMECLEGETLAQRLAKSALSLDQALQVSIQIADALDKAHHTGIVHRDLKPGNIFLVRSKGSRGGGSALPVAKLLDFGLAKAHPLGTPGGLALSAAPTVSAPLGAARAEPFGGSQGGPLTGAGTILGTVQYMAPEQLEGQEADARTDIFALGAVVYEMVTGKRAFEGKSQASLIGAIMNSEPTPLSTLRPITPPALGRIVSTCLAKDPDDRWQTARDLLRELRWVADGVSATTVTMPSSSAGRRAAWVAGAALSLAALVGGLALGLRLRGTPPQPMLQLEVSPPAGTYFPGANSVPRFAVSPDGRSLAYAAGPPNGPFHLWVRRLSSLAPQPLRSTEADRDGAVQGPFWFPDGRSIGFFDEVAGQLKKVDVQSGAVQVLADMPGNQMGGTVNAAGVILYSTISTKGVQRVPASGGESAPLTALDPARDEVAHLWPRFLPDGRRFLYLSQSRQRDQWAVYAASIDSAERKEVLRTGFMAEFAPPNHLLFVRGDALFAQTLDLGRLELTGEPVLVAQSILGTVAGRPGVSVSENGVLVHTGSGAVAGRTLVWVDREGREEPLPVPPREYLYPRLSPDGTRVAVSASDEERDIWLWDLQRSTLTRLTFEPGVDASPLWTPDGRGLVFSSNRDGGPSNLYVQSADGTGSALRLTEDEYAASATGISADGARVVFHQLTPNQQRDLRMLILAPRAPGSASAPTGDDSGGVVTLLETRFDEGGGALSPDGRWLAYESNSSGRSEVYVRPFPNVGDGQWQISTGGGVQPLWARSGRELFYLSNDGALMAVSVTGDGTWRAGTPTVVFKGGYYTGGVGVLPRQYDVSPDGQRFLMIKLNGGGSWAGVQNLVVVQNWLETLRVGIPLN
jgi:Tol biopolymer transport system component